MDIKNINPKNVLAILSVVLIVVFVTSGAIFVAKNVKSGPVGLLNALENIFSEKNKTAEKVGIGKVMDINGNTITVQGTITTTYEINVSGAKINKVSGQDIQNISLSDIKAGDTIQISGTVHNNPISVASIIDNGPVPNFFSSINNLSSLTGRSSISQNVTGSQNVTTSANISNILRDIIIKP